MCFSYAFKWLSLSLKTFNVLGLLISADTKIAHMSYLLTTLPRVYVSSLDNTFYHATSGRHNLSHEIYTQFCSAFVLWLCEYLFMHLRHLSIPFSVDSLSSEQ